jgi:hypothetical protein
MATQRPPTTPSSPRRRARATRTRPRCRATPFAPTSRAPRAFTGFWGAAPRVSAPGPPRIRESRNPRLLATDLDRFVEENRAIPHAQFIRRVLGGQAAQSQPPPGLPSAGRISMFGRPAA